MSQRLLFFGNERLATGTTTTAPVLRGLIEKGYEIAAVIVGQNDRGKSRKARQLEVAEVAEQYNIPLLALPTLIEEKDELAKYKAEAGILVAYGKLVPQEILDLFPKGIINIHPSLLPEYRGSTPIETVILKGKTETGVTLMKLSLKLDAGPIYAQEKVKLSGNESKQEVADRLAELGRDMLLERLPRILDGSLAPKPQDDAKATYTKKITKESGVIDLDTSAEQLVREIRAYAGWPRTRHLLATKEVVITDAHASDMQGLRGTLMLNGTQLGIHLENGTLMIDRLIPPGSKEMTGEAFLAGYHPL